MTTTTHRNVRGRIIDRPELTDDAATRLVVSVYGNAGAPDAVLPITARYLESLYLRAAAFDEAMDKLAEAVVTVGDFVDEPGKQPCACHESTLYDGLLDEYGRCQDGIDAADQDARDEARGADL